MSFYNDIQQYLNNLAVNAHANPLAMNRKPKKTLEEKRAQSRSKYRTRIERESEEQRQRRLERDRTRHQLRYREKKMKEQMIQAIKQNPNMSVAQAQSLLAQIPSARKGGAHTSHSAHQHHHHHHHFGHGSPDGATPHSSPLDFLQLCSNDDSTDSSRSGIEDPFKAELRRSRNAAKYYRRLMNETDEQRQLRLEKDRIRHKLKYVQQKQEKIKMDLIGSSGSGTNSCSHASASGSSHNFGSMIGQASTSNNNSHPPPSNVSTFPSIYSKLHPAFPSSHFSNSFIPTSNSHQASTPGFSNRYNLRDYPYF